MNSKVYRLSTRSIVDFSNISLYTMDIHKPVLAAINLHFFVSSLSQVYDTTAGLKLWLHIGLEY